MFLLTAECQVLPNKYGRSSGSKNQHVAIIIIILGQARFVNECWILGVNLVSSRIVLLLKCPPQVG